jgi:hypothetical protein
LVVGCCRQLGGIWLASSSQSGPHSDFRVSPWSCFAFNAPAWISMAPQIVSDAELPAAVTLSGLQLNISGIYWPSFGRAGDLFDGTKFCVCGQCRLFLRCYPGDRALEASNRASEASARELFRIVSDGYPLRPLRTRAADHIGAKCPVCFVHFGDSRIDARCGPESATSRPLPTRALIYKHGGRLGCRGCVYHSMA